AAAPGAPRGYPAPRCALRPENLLRARQVGESGQSGSPRGPRELSLARQYPRARERHRAGARSRKGRHPRRPRARASQQVPVEIPTDGIDLEAPLDQIEQRYLQVALARTGDVQTRAAELLRV